MTEKPHATCATCPFFSDDECRLEPPVPVQGEEGLFWSFPPTWSGMWCSSHPERKAEDSRQFLGVANEAKEEQEMTPEEQAVMNELLRFVKGLKSRYEDVSHFLDEWDRMRGRPVKTDWRDSQRK